LNIRTRGALVFCIGAAVFGLIAFWISHPSQYPFKYYPAGPGGALIIGIPGAAAIIGLVEMGTGKPFRELENTWASLSWWKKALLGSVIVIVGGILAFAIVGMLVR
jgi:hypothetical protein